MSMYKTAIVMIILIAGSIWGAGFVSGYYHAEPSPRQCETFTVGVATEKGAVVLGTIDLCGHDLEWGDVQEPVRGDNT